MAIRLSVQHRVGVLLGVLCLGFGAIAATELGDAPATARDQPPPAAAGKSPAKNTAATFALPPLERFGVVTERPLFSPDRKPTQHADNTAGAWSSFVLAGIIITSQSREALVLHGKPQAVAHIQEGQALEGWTVTAIDPDRVVFRDGANEHELRLTPKAAPPTVTTRARVVE